MYIFYTVLGFQFLTTLALLLLPILFIEGDNYSLTALGDQPVLF
jgi:hypothetical protein